MTKPDAADPPAGRPGLTQLYSDDHLARRARKGDRRAFEAIYRRYHQSLYRFCLTMAGNPQDAQDALQNTMVKALRSLPGEQRHIRLKPWLYRVARNESLEIIRRRRDSVAIESDRILSTLELAEDVETRARLRRLLTDLAALPERQRAALTMRELGGFDFEQIAEALDTSPATARQTVYEARLSLRQMEAGREMKCKQVMWVVSEADGRVTRRRDIQSHLRTCSECRAFRDAITKRRGELGAMTTLPLATSAALLHSVLGGGAAATSGVVVKSVATVAVVAALGISAADRSGLVEVPLPGRGDPERSAPASFPPAEVAAGASAPGAATSAVAENGAGSAAAGRATAEQRQGVGSTAPVTGATQAGGGPDPSAPPTQTASSHGSGDKGGHGGPAPASSHGQQTAASHKSPQANASPGTPRGRQRTTAPASGYHGRAKAPKAPATPPARSAKPPASGRPESAVPPDKSHADTFQPGGKAAEPSAADTSKEAR